MFDKALIYQNIKIENENILSNKKAYVQIKLSNEKLINSRLYLDILINIEIPVYFLKHEVFNDMIYKFEDTKSLNVEIIVMN